MLTFASTYQLVQIGRVPLGVFTFSSVFVKQLRYLSEMSVGHKCIVVRAFNRIFTETVELDILLGHVLSTEKELLEVLKKICELPPFSRRQSKLAEPPQPSARTGCEDC